MVNNLWWSDVEIISSGCSGPGAPHDQMPALLHPEGVYIGRYSSGVHSATCRHQALDELHAVIDRTETEAVLTVAGDLNNWTQNHL